MLDWPPSPIPKLSASLEFHSFAPAERSLRLPAAKGFARLDVRAPLRNEWLSPKAELSAASRTLAPAKATLGVCDPERDLIPPRDAESLSVGGQLMHRLTLRYEWEMPGGAEPKGLAAVPRFDAMHEQVEI